jgi:hypothetical protein
VPARGVTHFSPQSSREGMGDMKLNVFILVVGLSVLLTACPGGPPGSGTLDVTIAGLPNGVDADVAVSGPGGFAATLTASDMLTGLTPGSYLIEANDVVVGEDTYVGAVSGSPASIVPGATVSATVDYATQEPVDPPDGSGDELTERSLTDPTGWWWLTGVDLETIEAKIDEGFRIIDLEIDATSPWRFTAAFVANSGVHQKDWWWYFGEPVTIDFIEEKLEEHDARILDLETFMIDGQQRFAVVLVPNSGEDAKDWWWYVNATPEFLADEINANQSRIVDLDVYQIGGITHYSAVMIRNTGPDYKDWWWYLGADHDFIVGKLNEHEARIVDLERLAPDSYSVILEQNPGKGWWWWVGGSMDTINMLANQNGARIIDVERYLENDQTRFSAVFLENGDPSGIPVTGSGSEHLDPMLLALKDFMRHRCVGAAILGVSLHGQPVGVWGLGRMEGRAANDWDPECGDDFGAALSEPVPADTPMRIGSISKPVTAAMTRWAVKRTANDLMGLGLTDEQVEGLRLFDPDFYPPLIPGTTISYPVPLIPRDLYMLFSGQEPFPVSVTDGVCGTLDSGFADPQWQDVTLGHLLGHRSGLQRSAPDYTTVVVPNLAAVRALTTQGDFQAQEQLVRSEWGNAPVDAARAQLGIGSGDGYLLPGPDLRESLMVLAGRCLRFPLGERNYSNTSPAFPTIILQELMPSGNYSAIVNRPWTHGGSALDVFFRTELGIATTGTSGIFLTLLGDVEGHPNREPEKRHWSGDSYYWNDWDPKRPFCAWTGGACTFSSYLGANPGRINWGFTLDQVPFAYTGTGASPGTGSLATEADVFLAFMAEYWVNGGAGTDSATPQIGRERNGDSSRYVWHNGALNGTHAWALQIGGSDKPGSRNLPPIDAHGRFTDDFANLSPVTLSLPDGLDIFVAINQRGTTSDGGTDSGDRKCVEDASYTCADAYNMLPAFLFYGASQVDWNLVPPLE